MCSTSGLIRAAGSVALGRNQMAVLLCALQLVAVSAEIRRSTDGYRMFGTVFLEELLEKGPTVFYPLRGRQNSLNSDTIEP
jgi:hypothetical protein